MRKSYFTFIMALCVWTSAWSQTFSDNFDAYTAGAFLANTNNSWKTWGNHPGGADDIKVSNAKAKSGNNSLYFTSTVATGGPSDIVLPFGGTMLSTGTFNLSMWMFVSTQKKAYFNLQEQTTLGKGWSVDVNFDSLGKFNLVNTTSGVLLMGDYPQNAWMKVEFKINLSTNSCDFLINDVSKGVFQNSYRTVASMDIYPTLNSSFYIDDVSYTYTPFTPANVDGAITFIDKMTGRLAGQMATPVVEIRNLGTAAITSASVALVYNGSTQTKTLSGLNIASMATYLVTMDNPVKIVSGSNNVVATLTAVNGGADADAADNVKTLNLNPVVPAPGKVVVAEESTGTWCPWCPRGAVWLKNMDERYPGLIMGIAVHNADPMTNSNYDKGLGSISSGYPSMVVDRGTDIDPQAIEADFLDRIVVPASGTIRGGALYNTSTMELKVSLTTKFNKSVSSGWRVAFVLIEDSMTGTGSTWNQANNYANNANGVMGGFELLPNPVPASQMIYNHVGRVIYPNFKGLPNSFPGTVNMNDSFTHNFSVTLDATYRVSKLKIGGLLIDPNGRIDNGSEATLDEAIANGYIQGTAVTGITQAVKQNGNVAVFPNPSTAMFNLVLPEQVKGNATINVYDMQGKLIDSRQTNGNGISIQAQSWPAGFYTGIISYEGGSMQVKLVKE